MCIRDRLGVVLNIANMRTKHAKQTLEALDERFPGKVFDSVIRQSIAYAESAERAVPILDYKPDRGVDYLGLTAEVVTRLGMPERLGRLEQLRRDTLPARVLAETEPVGTL